MSGMQAAVSALMNGNTVSWVTAKAAVERIPTQIQKQGKYPLAVQKTQVELCLSDFSNALKTNDELCHRGGCSHAGDELFCHSSSLECLGVSGSLMGRNPLELFPVARISHEQTMVSKYSHKPHCSRRKMCLRMS